MVSLLELINARRQQIISGKSWGEILDCFSIRQRVFYHLKPKGNSSLRPGRIIDLKNKSAAPFSYCST